MQNRKIKILGIASAVLLLTCTWALAADKSEGVVALQDTFVDVQKDTATLAVKRQRAAALPENGTGNMVVANRKHVREGWRQERLHEQDERLLRMQRALPPYETQGEL